MLRMALVPGRLLGLLLHPRSIYVSLMSSRRRPRKRT